MAPPRGPVPPVVRIVCKVQGPLCLGFVELGRKASKCLPCAGQTRSRKKRNAYHQRNFGQHTIS